MLLLRFIVIILLFPLTAYAGSDSWCSSNKAPRINVIPSTNNISYNFTLSEKQLNGFNIDTVNPYGDKVITDVGGLMHGGIETQQKMTLGTITNPSTKQTCYYFDQINVSMKINPTVYVANEFKQGSCMHSAILAHEHKHVITDREIVNKYAAIMGQYLQKELTGVRIYGPVSMSQAPALESAMKARMTQIFNYVTTQMSAERKSRQQQIDSLSEYQSVNNMCKGKR